jgi:hypothetical protein
MSTRAPGPAELLWSPTLDWPNPPPPEIAIDLLLDMADSWRIPIGDAALCWSWSLGPPRGRPSWAGLPWSRPVRQWELSGSGLVPVDHPFAHLSLGGGFLIGPEKMYYLHGVIDWSLRLDAEPGPSFTVKGLAWKSLLTPEGYPILDATSTALDRSKSA